MRSLTQAMTSVRPHAKSQARTEAPMNADKNSQTWLNGMLPGLCCAGSSTLLINDLVK